jgi:hypothetical protein
MSDFQIGTEFPAIYIADGVALPPFATYKSALSATYSVGKYAVKVEKIPLVIVLEVRTFENVVETHGGITC